MLATKQVFCYGGVGMKHSFRYAFTMIEMAIVLAIIGLLAGGILGGKALLANMQIRKVVTDAMTYIGTGEQFRGQYGYLPGDFPKATEIWGRADGGTPITSNCAAPITDTSTTVSKATCNGDGNNILSAGAGSSENFRYFQQLSNAGYIGGTYTGVTGSGSVNHSVPGQNTPVSAIRGGAYFIYSWGVYSGSANYFDGNYNNILIFGKVHATSWPNNGIISNKQAYNIDLKYDDGKPAFGNIRTRKNAGLSTCATTDASLTAVYNLASTEPQACHLYLSMDGLMKSGGGE
jgi:prepilin-type N-terminal cleavage/methylation domain-containing protein